MDVGGLFSGEAFNGDSACSTPFVSAPSSPGRDSPSVLRPVAGVFFSAPTSPTRFPTFESGELELESEFDFSARFSPAAAAAATADELFLNGQIRPMRLSSHLLRPQALPTLPELDDAGDKACGDVSSGWSRLRNSSLHRKTRSLSPLRSLLGEEAEVKDSAAATPAPAASRSSSSSSTTSTSSSTSGKSSRKWVIFKDLLLHRSKSEGDGTRNGRPFLGPISFFKSKNPSSSPAPVKREPPSPAAPARRKLTAQERIYATRRAEAEAARRRTALPYRPGLLGCFGAAGAAGAVAGIARGINAAVSSR